MEQEANQQSEVVRQNSDDEFLRIRMLSNDIRQSPIEDVHILTEDEQEGIQFYLKIFNRVAWFLDFKRSL